MAAQEGLKSALAEESDAEVREEIRLALRELSAVPSQPAAMSDKR
jgi:hypothetical protein